MKRLSWKACAFVALMCAGLGSCVKAHAQPTVALLDSENNGDTLLVTCVVGGQLVQMLVDTGATIGTVTEDIAGILLARGEAHEIESINLRMADNTTRDERQIIIHRVIIGTDHSIARNVRFGVVANGPGHMLLGLNALNQFGAFVIDARKQRLVLGITSYPYSK